MIAWLVAAAGLRAQETRLSALSLTAPFAAESLAQWAVSPSALGVDAAGERLRGAKPGQLFAMRSAHALSLEERFDLRVEFAFEQGEAGAGGEGESLLLLQLGGHPALPDSSHVLLNGLVLALYQKEGRPALLSHRFFAEELRARAGRGAMETLFGGRGGEGSCEVGDFFAVEGLRLTLAPPEQLRAEYRLKGEWLPCLRLPAPPARPLLHLQALLDPSRGRVLALRRLELRERPHALDLDAALLVSHGLVGEIFEKVAGFGAKLSARRGGLGRVSAAMNAFGAQTARLEAYAHDLARGTALFQSAVMAAFSAQRRLAPADLPQLRRVGEAVARIEALHGRVYARLSDIRRLTRAQSSFRKTAENVERAAEKLEQLRGLSEEPAFLQLLAESNSLVDVLGAVDVEGVLAQLQRLEAGTWAGHTRTALAVALSMAVLAVSAAVLIARRISLAEKRMFL